ncbi:MAG: tryptophan--tRNA ligase [Gammaproteobacteria bacterium]|nr:tryptophan--tRNA ligase [Gammaproteobacteria bacterium]
MIFNATENTRTLSGMRPTGKLHLGHYHGVLKNWVRMQEDYDCFFFVADWHALTTTYENPESMSEHVWDMVVDWLSSGVDPEKATLFIQSSLLQHAELHLLLSMVTPLGWLERVPSFKEQQQRLADKDLSTYGFLGYPLLQSADILMYRAAYVPVGEDQVPHVELTREIARRFNSFFGKGPDYDRELDQAISVMGKEDSNQFRRYRRKYTEQGDRNAHEHAEAMIRNHDQLDNDQKQLLIGYIEGRGKALLPEPEALLTEAAKTPGLDGQKMSKSYNNIIAMRDEPKRIEKSVRAMPTDPARVRLTDPGDPDKCPVWPLHKIYSDADTREWVQAGCRTASFGCVQCKQPLIGKILEEQEVIGDRAKPYVQNPGLVKEIIVEGNRKASRVADQTMDIVRSAVGTKYL